MRNMSYSKNILFFILALGLSISSCVEPTDLGQELLQEDFVGTGFLNDFELHSRTVESDSIRTYSEFSQNSSFFVGNMADPFYGTVQASFTLEAGLYRTAGGAVTNSPDFKDVTLDSVVMVLQLDKSKSYGFTNENFIIDIDELDTRLNAKEDYYSNLQLALNPFGGLDEQFEYFPRIESLTTIEYNNTLDFDLDPDTISFPHLRFRLSNEFGQRLIDADSTTFLTDSTFLDFFKGVHISSSSKNAGIIAFDKMSLGVSDATGGIYVYVSNNQGKAGQYKFSFNDYRFHGAQFEHNYSNSMVEPFLNDATLGDSMTFVQGLVGLSSVVTLANLDQLQGKIINKAELKINIAKLEGDDIFYNPEVEQIMALYRSDDGDLVEIKDFSLARSALSLQFGGVIQKGVDGAPDYYKINITNHLQDIIDGKVSNEIYLGCYNSTQTPTRVALYGAGHSEYPMELKVNFTDPN